MVRTPKRGGSDEHDGKVEEAEGAWIELPGLGKPGALEKRNFPPGQHGRTVVKKKLTQYAVQLHEKQKLLFHYGLREEQLRRFVRTAQSKSSSNWIDTLVSLLERRVDNIVFRLGFARSMAAARQLVSHGHVLVDDRILTIGSALVKPGSSVRLTEYAGGAMTEASRLSPRLPLPSFLRFASEGINTHGLVLLTPGLEHVPFAFDARQVAEYYAKRGV
jgi:small subunit ribosomal protein S4